ncbi:MAG: phage tail protein [Thiotrichales bacterium]|nr:phage tail protein [Thiotrichales bacterium]
MKALQSLLDFLTKTGEVVAEEKIEAWAEDGEVLFVTSENFDGYELKYKANFALYDVTVTPVDLFMWVTYWMNKYIPDRDQQGLPAPEFFSEPLKDNHFDLGLIIEFKEQIRLVEDPAGDWLLDDGKRYRPESDFGVDEVTGTLDLFDAVTQDNGLTN